MSSTVHGGMSVYVVLDFIGKSRLRYYYLSSRRHSVRHQLCDHLNPVRKPKEKKRKKKKREEQVTLVVVGLRSLAGFFFC